MLITVQVSWSLKVADELGDETLSADPYAGLLAGASLADVTREARLREFCSGLPVPGAPS